MRVRLKKSTRVLYFDCVLNAIVKGNDVVGVSTLARDVTEEREKERRFTELFETLQEGVYFSTPEGKLLEANPALVQMLGYGGKDELLSLEASALNPVLRKAQCWDEAPTIAAASARERSPCVARMEASAPSSIPRVPFGTRQGRSSAIRARW